MATLKANAALAGSNARQVHAGTVTRKFVYSVTASLSAGDIIQLVKVPHGAIIDSIMLTRTGAGQFTGTVGDGGDDDRFFGSSTLVASTVFTNANMLATGVGYQYDISDNAAEQFDTIDLTVDTVTTATAAGVITGYVQYHCDESDP